MIKEDGTTINEADNLAHATDPTGAWITLDKLHSIIDRGAMFSIQRKLTLAGGATAYMSGLTDNTVHFIQQAFVANAGNIEIRLFRDATLTPGTGSPYSSQNRNDNYQDIIVPTFSVLDAPTVVDPGIEKGLVYMPASSNPVSSGTQSSGQDEWILKGGGTQYLLEFKNLDAVTSKTIGASMMYYEPALLPFFEGVQQ